MYSSGRKSWLLLFVLFLLAVNFFLFRLEWLAARRGFTFAMLDVGQGDALFLESPSGTQVLIDGGPPGRVLGPLSRLMSPFDRSLNALVVTNPDADHIAGFLDVLRVYKVGAVLEPGVLTDSRTHKNLKEEVAKHGIPSVLARKGMRLDLSGGAVIDILFPDRDVSDWSTNDGSIVARLTYGSFSALLAGDSTEYTEKLILQDNPAGVLRSDILKVGHHGSRTSTSVDFAEAVSPDYALISAGRENRYGHPHKEVLDVLESSGARVFRTDQDGTIIFACDRMAERCGIKKSRN